VRGASTVAAWEIMSEYTFRTRFRGQIVAEFVPPHTPHLAIMLKNLNSVTRCYNRYVIQCLRTPFRSQHAAGADLSPGLLQSGTVVPPPKQGAASLPSQSLAPWA